MGFLENLERKKREEAEIKRQKEAERRPIEIMSQLTNSRESVESHEEKAKKYYVESGCKALVDKLATTTGNSVSVCNIKYGEVEKSWKLEQYNFKLLKYKKIRYQLFMDRFLGYVEYKNNGFGSHAVFLEWSTDEKQMRNGRTMWKGNCLAIETCPDGEIHFYGGIFGSSVIREDQWRDNKDCLEEALGKAYYHPKQKIHISDPPHAQENYFPS